MRYLHSEDGDRASSRTIRSSLSILQDLLDLMMIEVSIHVLSCGGVRDRETNLLEVLFLVFVMHDVSRIHRHSLKKEIDERT